METNTANDTNKIIHKELSYALYGILFQAHNQLGRFCREKQYADKIELLLKEAKIDYKREKTTEIKNIPDFIVDNKIVLELKAEPIVLKDNYYQVQRYLKDLNIKLGLLVNFRNKYLKPIRIIRTDS